VESPYISGKAERTGAEEAAARPSGLIQNSARRARMEASMARHSRAGRRFVVHVFAWLAPPILLALGARAAAAQSCPYSLPAAHFQDTAWTGFPEAYLTGQVLHVSGGMYM
jgi:hypothetical protein